MAGNRITTREEILQGNLSLHDAEHATNYDSDRYEIFGYWEQRRILRELKELAPAGKICLDIGAGTGNLTEKLLRLGATEVVAVELCQPMIEVMKNKLLPQYEDRLTIVNADIDSFLDRSQRKFDIICEYSVLHHLPDYIETLIEIKEHLSPRGDLYLDHEPAVDNRRVSIIRIYNRLCNLPDRIRHMLWKAAKNPSLIVERLKGKPQKLHVSTNCEEAISWQKIDQLFRRDDFFRVVKADTYLEVPCGWYRLILWLVFSRLIGGQLRVLQKIG